ncbi:hypothetical protein M422DRAFT_220678 [Sphaerobolus stellatus SS14]|nr:hypothetical protein M422DRAFT_220678 [Sphaerobolus stellatus SS14]
MAFQSPQTGGTQDLWLRFPDNAGQHPQITMEQAIGLLTQAGELATKVPFAWSYIDKPPDGQAYLVYIFNPNPSSFAPDGIRFLEQEKTFRIPAGLRELEVSEVRYGFVPGVETTASRSRRRYRIVKGGNPQLMLMHYFRADATVVPQNLLNVQIRHYPLRQVNEPRVFVAGERMGQRVPNTLPGPQANGVAPGIPGPIPPQAAMGPTPMMNPAAMNPMGMSGSLGLGINTAQLAHQNQAMDGMERERRARMAAAAYPAGAPIPGAPAVPAAAAPPVPRPVDEEDSGDEFEAISTRTLAIERFKRNHELMADVFTAASKGIRSAPTLPSPYAPLDANELTAKVNKLNAEVEILKAKAEQKRLEREAANTNSSMDISNSALLMAS